MLWWYGSTVNCIDSFSIKLRPKPKKLKLYLSILQSFPGVRFTLRCSTKQPPNNGDDTGAWSRGWHPCIRRSDSTPLRCQVQDQSGGWCRRCEGGLHLQTGHCGGHGGQRSWAGRSCHPLAGSVRGGCQ